MSEILRKPEKLRLQGICKIPAGKAGKAAARQYANERKARKKALSQLAAADSKAGIGLSYATPYPQSCPWVQRH